MQTKPPKPKRCPCCKEMYTPKRYGLRLTRCCENAGCRLDYAQGVRAKEAKPKGKIVVKKAKTAPKPKPKTVAKLKKELWPLLSLHQKLVYSEDGEWCNCYTCDAPIRIGTSNCQGGHNLSKAGCPNIYWDERCIRPQCNKCNSYYGGMHYEFNERLKQEIGMEAWQDMYDNRMKVNKHPRQWFEEKIAYYSAEIPRLKQQRNSY